MASFDFDARALWDNLIKGAKKVEVKPWRFSYLIETSAKGRNIKWSNH